MADAADSKAAPPELEKPREAENAPDREPSEVNPKGASEAAADCAASRIDTEEALAAALTKATEAGRWDVAGLIVRELEARRLAGSNVIPLPARRENGGGR